MAQEIEVHVMIYWKLIFVEHSDHPLKYLLMQVPKEFCKLAKTPDGSNATAGSSISKCNIHVLRVALNIHALYETTCSAGPTDRTITLQTITLDKTMETYTGISKAISLFL